jgi:hypothetical protein
MQYWQYFIGLKTLTLQGWHTAVSHMHNIINNTNWLLLLLLLLLGLLLGHDACTGV